MGLLLWFSLFEYVYIFQSSKSEMYMCLIQLFFLVFKIRCEFGIVIYDVF